MLREYSYWFILTILILLLPSQGLYSQPKIIHQPPKDVLVNNPITIEALIEGNTVDIKSVRLFYRIAKTETYVEAEMPEIMGVYRYSIPAKYVTPQGVEYFIMVEFTDSSLLAFPQVDPFNVPMFLSVRGRLPQNGQGKITNEVQGGLPNRALILSPEEGEIVASQELLIAVSLFGIENIDLNSVKVYVDDIDITSIAQISEDIISATPRNLFPGVHTAKVVFSDLKGISYNPLIWSFNLVRTVVEAEQVLNLSANLNAEISSEQVRGVRQDISQVRGSFNVSKEWIDFNANIYLTDLENPDRQPRNRYSARINTGKLNLAFGDVNPQVSEFSIRGKRVRGLEGALLLKLFNLHFVYGETERAIAGTISSQPETLSNGNLLYKRSGYTYGRKLLAIRPYFGTGKNFQFGLYFMKSRDDTLSVDLGMHGIYPDVNREVVFRGVTPQDNIVVGTDLTLAFDNKRFVWQTEAALSYWNRNITGGALSKAALDTIAPGDTLLDGKLTIEGGGSFDLNMLPIDPKSLEDIFIINKYIQPLLPINLDTNIVIGILNMPASAFRTQLMLNYFNNYIVFKYQRVGPEFKSLGNPYMRTDVQGFSISDRIRLFQNRVFITLNYEQLRDNLLNQNKFTVTTTNLGVGLALLLGENLPTINLGVSQYGRTNNVDTIRYDIYNRIVDERESNVTLRQDVRVEHTIRTFNVRNIVSFNYAYSQRSDRLAASRDTSYKFNSMLTKMVGVSVNSIYPFPLKTSIRYSNNHSESGLSPQPYDFNSISVQAEYGFLKGKLETIFGFTLVNGRGLADFSQHSNYMGAQITLYKIHQIRGFYSFTRLNDRTTGEKFNDFSFNISYSMSF